LNKHRLKKRKKKFNMMNNNQKERCTNPRRLMMKLSLKMNKFKGWMMMTNTVRPRRRIQKGTQSKISFIGY
jgi:hypothetical protein